MQREAPLTPKSRKIRSAAPSTPDRTQSASMESLAAPRARIQSHRVPRTLDRTLSGSMESLTAPGARAHGHRTTMAPGEFLVPAPGIFGKKRVPSTRESIMPGSHGQSLLDETKRLEPDNKDLEMRILYDKCLQNTMVELLMKEKAEEKAKAIVSQLGTLAKEDDTLHEKLFSIKAKEKDLRVYIELQNDLDNHFAELTASLEKFDKKPVEILEQLKSTLESLDTLRCKNIAIPEKPEDMHKIRDLFAKCSDNLQLINNFIGNRRNVFSTVNRELIEFTRAHDDVQNLAKKAEQTLCSLQVEVLKDAARSVIRNQL